MKALVFAQQQPTAEDNGSSIRTMNFVRYLSAFATVDLIYRQNLSGETRPNPCRIVEPVPIEDAGRLDKGLQLLRHPLSFPTYARKHYSTELARYVSGLVKAEHYDVILVRYGHNVAHLRGLPASIRRRMVIDLDDLYLDNLYRHFRVVTRYPIKEKVDRYQLEGFEAACGSEFGQMILCSEDDKQRYLARHRSFDPSRISVVPNVIRPPGTVTDRARLPDEPIMLFVGTLNYKANVDGLTWFLDNVYDSFKRRFPLGRFYVVGRRPRDDIRARIARDPTITLFEEVPDLQPYYDEADLIVVPLLSGSGTRIKILEAALYGRPVVSTPIGAEGLELRDGSDVLLFSNEDQFGRALECLIEPAIYRAIVRNARAYVERDYSVATFDRAAAAALSRVARVPVSALCSETNGAR